MKTDKKKLVHEVIEDQNIKFDIPNDVLLDGLDKISAPLVAS